MSAAVKLALRMLQMVGLVAMERRPVKSIHGRHNGIDLELLPTTEENP